MCLEISLPCSLIITLTTRILHSQVFELPILMLGCGPAMVPAVPDLSRLLVQSAVRDSSAVLPAVSRLPQQISAPPRPAGDSNAGSPVHFLQGLLSTWSHLIRCHPASSLFSGILQFASGQSVMKC